MQPDEALGKILAAKKAEDLPLLPKYVTMEQNTVYHTYPDGSRSFEDLLSLICFITSAKPYLIVGYASLLKHRLSFARIPLKNGDPNALHRHNFVELEYVAQGKLYQRIAGRNVVFNEGEICLIDKDCIHCEYLYHKPSMVIFLGISNSFFEETSLFSTNNKKSSTADFLEKFVTRRKEPFQYLRLIPRDNTKRKTGKLLSRIIVEMARRESGYERIVEGCTERIINCLPREYEMKVHAQTRKEKELEILDKILLFIHEHYQDISITDLCAEFGLNRDYYNRLIKKHTGLTYSRYLENTRLEKALALLKSTNNTVESIARAVGYENQGFFYKRFFEKYGKKPRAVRE